MVKKQRNGDVYLKCDRCHAEIKEEKLVSMSEAGRNPHKVCFKCSRVWHEIFNSKIAPLTETNELWHKTWLKEYRAFIKNKSKEEVQFT